MPKKIGFIINSYAGGGAERIMGYIINNLDRAKFTPFLCLLLAQDRGYPLSGDVPVYVVDRAPSAFIKKLIIQVIAAFTALPALLSPSRFYSVRRHTQQMMEQIVRTVWGLRPIIDRERPDMLIVFLQTSIVITLLMLILFRIRVPICCSDRIILSKDILSFRFPVLNRLLVKLLYWRIDCYVAVSEEAKQDVISNFGIPAERILTIHNGVDHRLVRERAREPLSVAERAMFSPDTVTIITAGRLMEQKGHDILIKSFAIVRQRIASRLIILGEGEKRKELAALAQTLGIADDVFFNGWTDNPFKLIASADIFVLSSRYEGFPNALLEAMALGTPVVSTDCPSGPREILDGGRYGILVSVDDELARSEALLSLCLDPDLRGKFRELSRRRSAIYTLERMLIDYQSMIDDVMADTSRCRRG